MPDKPRIISGRGALDKKACFGCSPVIVVTLAEDGINSTDRLIRYLSLLVSDRKPLAERKQQLEEEYRIPMTRNLEEEMSGMCNMGEAINQYPFCPGPEEPDLREGRGGTGKHVGSGLLRESRSAHSAVKGESEPKTPANQNT